MAAIAWATRARQRAERALSSGSLAKAAEIMIASETCGQDAKCHVATYIKKTFATAESSVRVLQHTRTAALVTLGVLATIATAGATLGASTTVLGLQVGGTAAAANVIATGAPIVATLGEAGATAALGERVDWARVGVDVIANLVLARFGGHLAQGLFRSIGGSIVLNTIGGLAARRLVASVVTHEAAQVFTTTSTPSTASCAADRSPGGNSSRS